MIGRYFLAVAVASIGLPAFAGVAEHAASAKRLIENPSLTVLVVRIDQAPAEWEEADLPEGTMTVREVLRGKSFEPGEYRFRLYPDGSSIPDPAPEAGDELIVFTPASRPGKGETVFLSNPQIRLSPAAREKVERELVRNSPLLVPLFFVVLLAPVLGFLKRYGWLSVVVGWGGYVVYEMLMSPVYDIRVDLLILFPALAASLLVPLVMSFVWRRAEARASKSERQ